MCSLSCCLVMGQMLCCADTGSVSSPPGAAHAAVSMRPAQNPARPCVLKSTQVVGPSGCFVQSSGAAHRMPLALALHVFVLLFVLVAVLADHAAHAGHVCVMAKPFGLGLGNTRIAMSFWSTHAVEQACCEDKERRACHPDARFGR